MPVSIDARDVHGLLPFTSLLAGPGRSTEGYRVGLRVDVQGILRFATLFAGIDHSTESNSTSS